MIAPEDCDSLPKPHFQADQQRHLNYITSLIRNKMIWRNLLQWICVKRDQYRFDAVVAPVDIVAHEKVICVGRLSANSEKFHQVVELAVHVAAHSYGAFHLMALFELVWSIF